MAGSLTNYVAKLAKQRANSLPDEPSLNDLNDLLRLLGRWRSQVLANTYIERQGARIMSGPFAGMEYVSAATEGALIPRLLGTYDVAYETATGLSGTLHIGWLTFHADL